MTPPRAAGRAPWSTTRRGGVALCVLVLVGLGGIVAPARASTVSPPTALGASVTRASLAKARVPALCQHRAGRMTKGYLKDAAPDSGGTYLLSAKFGRIRPHRGREAVAVVGCDMGGVGWPDNLVMYSANNKVIGKLELGEILPGSRTAVHAVKIKKKRIVVQVSGVTQRGDDDLWGTADATLVVRWSSHRRRFVVTKKTIHTEKAFFKKILSLARQGKTDAIVRYSGMNPADTSKVTDILSYYRGVDRSKIRVDISCTATEQQTRLCSISGYERHCTHAEVYSCRSNGLGVEITRTKWRTYRVVSVGMFG